MLFGGMRMFTFLTFLAGAIGAVTVLQCGQLAAFYGSYSSSVVTHVVGLLAVMLLYASQRRRLPERRHAAPWMFLGGVIGAGTVVLNNMAFGGVGVTAIVGLGLLGQSVTSLFMDQFGLLGAAKVPFSARKLPGLAAVLAGALTMVLPLSGANLAAVLMALATGLTIVTARTVNARLADRQGAIRATVMNYVTGLTTSCVMLLLLGRGEPMLQGFRLSGNWFMYLAGALGVVLTVILNVTVSRVSAFALTLLQLTGQIFTGLLLDALLAGCFSIQSAVGGLLVAVGLGLNTWLDSRRK